MVPSGGAEGGALVQSQKRQRTEGQLVTKDGIKRTSHLAAPTMQLTGHAGEVYGCEFSQNGESLASCSFDKQVLLWHVGGECKNFALLKGHKNAVLEVHWLPDGEHLISASADRTVRGWDAHSGQQVSQDKLQQVLHVQRVVL